VPCKVTMHSWHQTLQKTRPREHLGSAVFMIHRVPKRGTLCSSSRKQEPSPQSVCEPSRHRKYSFHPCFLKAPQTSLSRFSFIHSVQKRRGGGEAKWQWVSMEEDAAHKSFQDLMLCSPGKVKHTVKYSALYQELEHHFHGKKTWPEKSERSM
jgi:hypothetical protein